MYLLQANCSRGSALEGCARSLEGGGPRGRKRACLSIRLYQKNTAATALKIRDGGSGGGRGGDEKVLAGGNKRSGRWIREGNERERKRHAMSCFGTNASVGKKKQKKKKAKQKQQ